MAMAAMVASLVFLAKPIKAAFPGTSSRIAFQARRVGNSEFFLYVMNPDGSEQTCFTSNAACDSATTISPDDTKVVFTSSRGDGNQEIYVMNSDDSKKKGLTNNPGTEAAPDWGVVVE